MVNVMKVFTKQLRFIGADPSNIPIRFDDSGARTQTVEITLSPEQNAKFLAEPMTLDRVS